MQYKVPQKIDLEDKVIGPLTIKQFIWLLGGGMAIYLIFTTFGGLFRWLLIFIAVILTLAFAFVRVEEQPFSYLATNFLSFLLSPKIRLWNKGTKIEKMVELKNKPREKRVTATRKSPEEIRSTLQTLSQVVDTHGWSPEQYKEELEQLGVERELQDRIKSTQTARQDFALDKDRKEGEIDPLLQVEK